MPIWAERIPPSNVDTCPLTGTVRLIASLRSILSALPVHTSTLGFLTEAAILPRVVSDSRLGSLPDPVTPAEFAFCRNVLRSVSSAATFTPARMCVVAAPPRLSLPTTDGLTSQRNGSIPSLASDPALPPPVGDEVTCAKLDAKRSNGAAGSG